MPLEYKGVKLAKGYTVDLVVAGKIAVELKAVTVLAPVFEAQLITYLRLGGWGTGLLINFNVPALKDGIRRKVLGFETR